LSGYKSRSKHANRKTPVSSPLKKAWEEKRGQNEMTDEELEREQLKLLGAGGSDVDLEEGDVEATR
jgi:hypothetical protein